MSKTTKQLKPLRRSLPELPGPEEVDEDGDKLYRGFCGDCSQSPLYVTDGHILLLASAIDPAIAIERNEDVWALKHATQAAIDKVWGAAEKREDLAADFIGTCPCCDSGHAFLRDTRGRVMVVNAFKLAFGVSALHPDTLTVSADLPLYGWFEAPLAFWRAGKLVGLLMPMKISAADFLGYDMHGEPVSLAAHKEG